MSPQPDVNAWYRGDPAARELGVAALTALGAFHDDSTDIRQAVTTQQKRWGDTPTGTLSPAEWQMLTDVSQLASDDVSRQPGEQPSRAADSDGSAS